MQTGKDRFTCLVCKQLYKNPVVHRPCGYSFDRECLGNICPRKECGQVVNENNLTKNHALLNIVDEYRLSLDLPSTYYLVLLDTSSSMWYSDSWLPFAIGESRFTPAIQFLNGFFRQKQNSPTDKVSLVTFDTSELQQFDFEVINESHFERLKNLTCDGKDTALFDSIDCCLEKLEKLNKIYANQISATFFILITDGGSNFGKKESERAAILLSRMRQLQLVGHSIQIGDRGRKRTKAMCESIEFKYNHFKGGDMSQFVNSFTNSMTLETRARLSQRQPSINQTEQLINQLPDVPNSKPIYQRRQKETA